MTGLYAFTCEDHNGIQVRCKPVAWPFMSVLGVTALEDLLLGKIRGAPALSSTQKKALENFLTLTRQCPVETLPFERHALEVPAAKRKPVVWPRSKSESIPMTVVSSRPTRAHVVWRPEHVDAGFFPSPMAPEDLASHINLAKKVRAAFNRLSKVFGLFFFEKIGVHIQSGAFYILDEMAMTPLDDQNPWPGFSLFVAVNAEGGFLARPAPSTRPEYATPWRIVATPEMAGFFSSLEEARESATRAWFENEKGHHVREHEWAFLESPVCFSGLAESSPGLALFPAVGPLTRQKLDEAITEDEIRRKLEELDAIKKNHPELFAPLPPPAPSAAFEGRGGFSPAHCERTVFGWFPALGNNLNPQGIGGVPAFGQCGKGLLVDDRS